MTTYHVIGILESDEVIDQTVTAADVMAAIGSFEADAYFQLGKVTALRLPCADEVAYHRQVALARDEAKEFRATPKQLKFI